MLDAELSLETLLDTWHGAEEREQHAMRRAQQVAASASSNRSDDALYQAEQELEAAKAERMRLEELYWEEYRLQQMPGYT